MNFTIALTSIGFIGRFVIAFIILACLYSKNKEDIYLRRGFRTLCILGALVFAAVVLSLIIFFAFGGISLLGSLLGGGGYHSYSFNFPF